jgi:hypothetical protein
MGNIGLGPEITREFLEKQYRSACETIARLTAENEHLLAVLMVIEAYSVECDLVDEERTGHACAVYRWAHVARNPTCIDKHPDWINQLETAIAIVQGPKP